MGLLALVLEVSGVAVIAVSPAQADAPWGTAIELPGIAALNAGGTASVGGVSCSSSGNCGVVGTYTDSGQHVQGFVANEVNATWTPAEAIPGLVTLNQGGFVETPDISCTSSSACSVSGTFRDSQGHLSAFVDDEVNGTWGVAQTLPRASSVPASTADAVIQITCTSPGNCVTTGTIGDSPGAQALVGTETNGSWGGAIEVPGVAALNTGGLAGAGALACPQAGECTMSGLYFDASHHFQSWVDQETSGTWGSAQEVPGLSALNTGGVALSNALSCPSVGTCVVAGGYAVSTTESEPFVADEVSGVWQNAIEAPGAAGLDAGGQGTINAVACPATGQCEAVGTYTDIDGGVQEFVMSQSSGTWQPMSEAPGTATLNASGGGLLPWVSCVGPGDCRSVGGYADASDNTQAYDASEVGGVWQNAEETPGSAQLNAGGGAFLRFVSCTPDGGCGAAGTVKDSHGGEVMVMSTTVPPAPSVPGAPRVALSSRVVGVVIISIAPPRSDGGSAITGYQYSVNGAGWRTTRVTRVTLRHLKPGSRVGVRARAFNVAGPGPSSGVATVRVR